MAPGQGELLEKLPPWTQFYENFEVGAKKCADGCTSNIEGALTLITDAVLKAKIEDAWSYLSYMHKGRGNSKNTAPCYFLYFWIGSKLSGSSAKNNFKHILWTICRSIKEIYRNDECQDICDSIDLDIFHPRKTVFEFWHNHSIIRELLEHSGPQGITQYETYFQGVRTAYNAVKGSCTNGGGHQYCTKFWPNHEQQINDKLSELETKLKSVQENRVLEAQTAYTKLDQSVRSATTNATVSSIFGTLGLTAVSFLLYKYTPLTSWFGNNSSGGGRGSTRKRRSNEQQFDELTETSTTEDFTGSSETSSTFDPTTVCSSTYTRPSTR